MLHLDTSDMLGNDMKQHDDIHKGSLARAHFQPS